ncbi:hypothetical protein [Nocardia sp. NPDC057668]|uniref:hypothetical protein n=1 Tax=Nocardia sp. NPDC057668 TaxID=3346202 RepID=UPI00366BC174
MFVLRDEDGRCLVLYRHGRGWAPRRADELAEVLAAIRREGRPAQELHERFIAGYHCEGMAIDLLEKRCHIYVCEGRSAAYRDSYAAGFGAEPTWAGWDVRYLWDEHEGLAVVMPETAHAVALDRRPPGDGDPLPLSSRDRWFSDWNAVRREITVLEDEWSADWYSDSCAVITIIQPDHTILDYRLDHIYVLDWLSAQGDSVIAALLEHAPYPLPGEYLADAGAIIDLTTRRLRYWTSEHTRLALPRYVAAAWQGWEVERLPFGYVGHLAVTGRADHEALLGDEGLLVSFYWDEDLLVHRHSARRALTVNDSRFRFSRVHVADGEGQRTEAG